MGFCVRFLVFISKYQSGMGKRHFLGISAANTRRSMGCRLGPLVLLVLGHELVVVVDGKANQEKAQEPHNPETHESENEHVINGVRGHDTNANEAPERNATKQRKGDAMRAVVEARVDLVHSRKQGSVEIRAQKKTWRLAKIPFPATMPRGVGFMFFFILYSFLRPHFRHNIHHNNTKYNVL
jgi:hypothetical protein